MIKCRITDKSGYEELNIETPIQNDDFVDLWTPIVQKTETQLNTTLRIAENTKNIVENTFNAIISCFQAFDKKDQYIEKFIKK